MRLPKDDRYCFRPSLAPENKREKNRIKQNLRRTVENIDSDEELEDFESFQKRYQRGR